MRFGRFLRLAFRISSLTKDSDGRNGDTTKRRENRSRISAIWTFTKMRWRLRIPRFVLVNMAFSRTTAFEHLRRADKQNRLAHAYLITGPPGSGKQLLAADLASLVNGTPAKDVFSARARDIFVARPESKSRRILIEQIRDLEHALQMRASNGRCKVAIIPDADRLVAQAANAFLKTLEEPPKDSLLLLLSALPEALPETILSRCIVIPLAPNEQRRSRDEEEKLVELLQHASRERKWAIQFAYGLAQEFQRLLREVREEVKRET